VLTPKNKLLLMVINMSQRYKKYSIDIQYFLCLGILLIIWLIAFYDRDELYLKKYATVGLSDCRIVESDGVAWA